MPGLAAALSQRSDDGEFHDSREGFRGEHGNLFLVHRLTPSREADQLYDVALFLVPSLRYGSLEGVRHVEYYFGKYWAGQIFKTVHRASGFLISTSAFAPFTCTARVEFSDGTRVFMHRYVDFEMGPLGSGPMQTNSGE